VFFCAPDLYPELVPHKVGRIIVEARKMNILAIDTTSNLGSIAITDGDRVIEEVVLQAGDGYDHVLFGEIESLLVRNNLRLLDIDVFASASGPGTFTGVRVGLAAVKGLAEALSRKVVAVSNLRAMAAFGTGERRAPWIDARRGDIYGAVYSSSLELVQEEVVEKYDAWLASLPADAEILSGARPLAGAIGKIAAREFTAGRAVDPVGVDANYVRRADAEMLWKDVR
jgi:tRNA threonylcarbamoyl adenosine modification protein YeaZ